MTRPLRLGLAVLALVGVAVAAAWLGGWRLAVLDSATMGATAPPGSLLVHRTVPATALAVGDVVTVDRDGTLVTHRVDRIERADVGVWLRLRGDANALPDLVRDRVPDEALLVTRVVPGLGRAWQVAGPVLGLASALLLAGALGLALGRERPATGDPDVGARVWGDDPRDVTGDVTVVTDTAQPEDDPRLVALLATAEQLAEDGVPQPVLRDLVRVRACELLRLPSVERSGAARALDDGARFYVVALVDADPDALALVPVGSARRAAGSRAVELWWSAVGPAVPPPVRTLLEPWTGWAD